MDISLSLCCLFIPKDTFSAFTRKGQRAIVYLQPSGPNGYCPVLQSPYTTDAIYIPRSSPALQNNASPHSGRWPCSDNGGYSRAEGGDGT